jgi:lipopolysaccharide export LptBFGC system permease protein LptF
VAGPGEVFGDVIDFLKEWLGDSDMTDDAGLLVAMRIILFFLVFMILFVAAHIIPNFNNRLSMVLALLIAIMTVLFFPTELLIAMGETYTTFIALLIFAVPIGTLIAILWYLPAAPWYWNLIRMGIIIFAWILLNIITTAAGGGL